MYYIDPHIHMISRVTDDYQRMALCGCVALTEPAFWAGFDRGSVEGFRDYFRHLTEYEPKRAAQYGIKHYSWLCINAKEAENVALSREVIAMIPEFLNRPNVLGIGEIGLNKNTKNEATIFQEHVDLAMKTNELMLIHTPHLEDKYKGTRMIVDMLKGDSRVDPGRVLIDHVEGTPKIRSWWSAPWGVVSLTESEGRAAIEGEDRLAAYNRMRERARLSFASFASTLPKDVEGIRLLGTSGTVTTLASVHLALPSYDRRAVDGLHVPIEAMQQISQMIAGMDYGERSSLPCIGPDRADLVVAGCAILEAILEIWPAEKLGVADRGIREGILRSLMARDGYVL